jgi:hypothetical protein
MSWNERHVSQILWQREHCSLARISIGAPPHAGQAGPQDDSDGFVTDDSDIGSLSMLWAVCWRITDWLAGGRFVAERGLYCLPTGRKSELAGEDAGL